mgnify:CR=1 FL=1
MTNKRQFVQNGLNPPKMIQQNVQQRGFNPPKTSQPQPPKPQTGSK